MTDITTLAGLQAMNGDLAGTYVLLNDIDASATSTWNDGLGFEPIGFGDTFTGSFDGGGHTISGLFINRPSDTGVGLFSVIDTYASLQNTVITGVNITGQYFVGGLSGFMAGPATNCSVSGTIHGTQYVGGLCGALYDNLLRAFSQCAVYGESDVGGLVGNADTLGSIRDSYSLSSVHGTSGATGGFLGTGGGGIGCSLYGCYCAGAVSADFGNASTGAFIGAVSADSYSTAWANFYNTTITGALPAVGVSGTALIGEDPLPLTTGEMGNATSFPVDTTYGSPPVSIWPSATWIFCDTPLLLWHDPVCPSGAGYFWTRTSGATQTFS